MEKRNLFVSGKAVVAAVCGAFTAAFGWLGWLVVAWADRDPDPGNLLFCAGKRASLF